MQPQNITYADAMELVMRENGGFAPLKLLYKEIWKFKDKSFVKGKTPDMTIQEKAQRDTRFTKIGLGVYALTAELKNMQDKSIVFEQENIDKPERLHATIQGMLLEIGNYRKDVAETYTNDKKFVFDNKTLGSLCTLQAIPYFTYNHIIDQSTRFADVIWFNHRKFPSDIFEVENSTDFRDAFIKFMELLDFQTKFYCVAPDSRKTKFDVEFKKEAFKPLYKEQRVKFITYEQVEQEYKQIGKTNFF